MADNWNEQELQTLFRKHLPMKQMPTDFAEQLKRQVLAEVSATLGSKPVATTVTEEAKLAPVVPIKERVSQPKAPRSLATRPTITWMEWFRDYFRWAPSLATAGAIMMLLIAVIVWRDYLPSPDPDPGATPGVETLSKVTSTASAGLIVTPTVTVVTAVASVLTVKATATPVETKTPGWAPASSEINSDIVETATPTPTDKAVTSIPKITGQPSVSGFEPTPTSTPTEEDERGREPTPTRAVQVAPDASATPTRVSHVLGTSGEGNNFPNPTPTRRLQGSPTATVTDAPGVKNESTATSTPIRRPLTITPTRTPLSIDDVVLSATPSPDSDQPDDSLTPFVPTDTPSPTPSPSSTPTSVLVASPTPTIYMQPFPTRTPTDLPFATDTAEPIATDTAEPTATVTPTETAPIEPPPTATATNTPSSTATNTPSPTATNTPWPTRTPTPTATNTPWPTATATDTPTPTATNTPWPTPTATATDTPVPTVTNTPWPTPTATATDTPLPTETPTPTATDTPVPTETPTPTATNAPPVIRSQPILSATVGVEYLYIIEAIDSDSPIDSVQIIWLEKPLLMEFIPLGVGYAELRWTPQDGDVGTAKVRIAATDGINSSEPQDFDIIVAPRVSVSGPFEDPIQGAGAAVVGDQSSSNPINAGTVTASDTVSGTVSN